MQTYELLVSGRSVRAASVDTTLVRTSIGIDQVHVLFDNAEWLEFPITATFAMGDVVRTAQLIVSDVDGDGWVAESTVTIPYEVIRRVGRIRVTFQGTDSQGRHIITAYGTPLSVVEAGDVEMGEIPEDAPTVDEWQQMRADAQRAINDAQSLVNDLQSRLDAIVSAAEGSLDGTIRDAEDAIAAIVESTRPIASEEILGMVRVGDGLNVTEEGVLSSYGLTQAQRRALANLVELASKVTDADVTGTVQASPRIDPDALPVATPLTLGTVMPDGTSIRVGNDGMIHAYAAQVDVATTSMAGKVKPDGETITVDADGTIHGADQTQVATTTVAGKVKPDGETITVDADGTIRAEGQVTLRVGYVGNSSYMTDRALIFGDDSDGVLEFPAVTAIPARAYMDCLSLTSVEFPACEAVGLSAFYFCSALTSIDLPACSAVGDYAFGYCYSLATVSLPVCNTIGSYAFDCCTSLASLSMRWCASVGYGAFEYCTALATVSLPACRSLGSTAFGHCSALATVSLPRCEAVGAYAFVSCSSLSFAGLSKCVDLGYYAFCGCTTLMRVSLPACSSVGDCAFWGCSSLASVSLPKCGRIGADAFARCASLMTLDLAGVSAVPALASTDAFLGTPMSDPTQSGAYGSIRVPRSLYSSFVTARHWSEYASRMVSA